MEVNCPHQDTLSTFACPVIGSEETAHSIKILCPQCFSDERHAVESMSLAALSDDKFCMDCGQNPARYNKSLMMSICDQCRLDQSSNFLQFSFQRIEKDKGQEIPSNIYDGRLYLGSQDSAANRLVFTDLHISHILVCGNGLGRFYEDENTVRYHQLPIDDSLDQNLEVFLSSGVQFIENAINNGGNVLVHCHAGVSRSASVVIAWLMKRMRCDYQSAYSYVKSRRSKIHPNSNFVHTLKYCWEPSCVDQRSSGNLSVGNASNLFVSSLNPPSALDTGLRTAMKSTSHSIRRFSDDCIGHWDFNNSGLASANAELMKEDNMNSASRDSVEEEFKLVLKSDRK